MFFIAILSLILNIGAFLYFLLGDTDGVGIFYAIIPAFFGFGSTLICGALLITRRKTLSRKMKVLGVIVVISFVLIPFGYYLDDLNNFCPKNSFITHAINKKTQQIESWKYDPVIKAYYLLEDGPFFNEDGLNYRKDVSPVSCYKFHWR